MSHFVRIRQQQQTWSRRALGLFAAVWLNLALQPCAMAFEVVEDHDCQHCPPEQMQEHGGMHGGMDDSMPCADNMADCAIVAALNHDGRDGKIKLKDMPADTPVAIAPHDLTLPVQRPVNATIHLRYASVHAGAPPPLHVLYCVYLK